MAKSSSNKRKTVEYGRYGYFFIAPFFIIFAIFQLWPLVYTMGLAFCENYTDTMFNVEVGPTFNGLKDFRRKRRRFIRYLYLPGIMEHNYYVADELPAADFAGASFGGLVYRYASKTESAGRIQNSDFYAEYYHSGYNFRFIL